LNEEGEQQLKVLIAALVAVSLAIPATLIASPAAPQAKDPRVPALQKQVAQLRQQVAQVQQAVSLVDSKAECYNAKEFNSTSGLSDVVSAIVTYITGTTYPDAPRVSDNGNCARIGLSPAQSPNLRALTQELTQLQRVAH
jgi:hypothetical protein